MATSLCEYCLNTIIEFLGEIILKFPCPMFDYAEFIFLIYEKVQRGLLALFVANLFLVTCIGNLES